MFIHFYYIYSHNAGHAKTHQDLGTTLIGRGVNPIATSRIQPTPKQIDTSHTSIYSVPGFAQGQGQRKHTQYLLDNSTRADTTEVKERNDLGFNNRSQCLSSANTTDSVNANINTSRNIHKPIEHIYKRIPDAAAAFGILLLYYVIYRSIKLLSTYIGKSNLSPL